MKIAQQHWQPWAARGVVLAYAALAGLAVLGFTWLSERASLGFDRLAAWQPLLPLVWTPICTASIAWLTLRFVPGAAGSGIPQVMAALSPALADQHRSALVCLRLSIAKALLSAGGLFGGLALGREGPSVQIAAGVMQGARRWWPARATIDPHTLLVAGGAAGVAAAFSAPLAGVMFAVEQLGRRIGHRHAGLIVMVIALAGLVTVALSGRAHHFGSIGLPPLGLEHLAHGVLLVLACGGLGGVFARLLHTSLIGSPDCFSRWRRSHPVRFAAGCGFAVATLGLASGGMSFGGGEEATRRLLTGQLEMVPVLYVAARVAATWLAVWSGVPGGIFTPALAIGAGLGQDIAALAGLDLHVAPLIVLGMAAFLAAVTQAPLTACIIVMEMVDGYAMAGSLALATLAASFISRGISTPLYATLALMHVQHLQHPQPQR